MLLDKVKKTIGPPRSMGFEEVVKLTFSVSLGQFISDHPVANEHLSEKIVATYKFVPLVKPFLCMFSAK